MGYTGDKELGKRNTRVHFVGIGGSGMSSVAVLAKHAGYEVTGCDRNTASDYLSEIRKQGIPVFEGHSPDHLEGTDLMVFTPAMLCSPNPIEELEIARSRGIAGTWQEFMGRYLQAGKTVIAVAGTHGKSTTTALLGSVLVSAGCDPTVELGAILEDWGSNVHLGASDLFLCEADEYNRNFLNYRPDVMLINNIEMDHPEFFADYADFRDAFDRFLRNIRGRKLLIANLDSEGVREFLADNRAYIEGEGIRVVGYGHSGPYDLPVSQQFTASQIWHGGGGTEFTVDDGSGQQFRYRFIFPGMHNLENALGVIAVARLLGVSHESIAEVLSTWKGIRRRLDRVAQVDGIDIYDDYAHHPTAMRATIEALRAQNSGREIWALVEFHQVSRLKLFFREFVEALALADRVVITDYFLGREQGKQAKDPEEVAGAIGHGKAKSIPRFEDVAQYTAENVKPNTTVIVFGAGNSYKLSRMVAELLRLQTADCRPQLCADSNGPL